MIFFILILWNIFVMLLYSADKFQAKTGGKRISEASLLSAAFLLGAVGAILGMILFHHKTSKTKFRILIPLALIFNAALIFCLFYINLPLPV